MLKWLKDFFLGIASYYKAGEMILKHNLWYYFIFPTVFLIFILLERDVLLNSIKDVRFDQLPADNWDFEVLLVSLKAIGFFLLKYLYGNVVLILSVPFLAMLSVSIEKTLTGNKYPFSFKQLLKDIRRGANVAVTNMIIQMLFIAGWYLLLLIFPVMQPASEIVVFCIGFYFYGFSFMDYTNERRRLNLEESMKFIRAHSGMAIAIGGVFATMFTYIPYAGVVIAPVMGVAAATFAVHKRVDLRKNKFAVREDRGNTRTK